MKILLLNVFEGGTEKNRYENLVSYVQKESPDILGLNELNNWEKKRHEILNAFLKKTGFPYHLFCLSKSGFSLGLFSRYPIQNQQIITKGFRTGAIMADISTPKLSLSVALTHLHYKNESLRLKELQLLLPLLHNKHNSILMGDLNSLSPHDIYDEKLLLPRMQSLGITKFGRDTLKKDVITEVLKNGFIDVVKHFSDKPEYTVPTPANNDADHFMRLRLDYIFIKKSLEKYLKKAKIVKNKQTNILSDHFPVSMEIAS